MRILLIEDDTALAMGTEYALTEEGMEVHVADSFAELQNYFLGMADDKDMPDCVLLDIMLPDADGYAICQWIKEKYPALPVIFLTALSDEGNVVRGLNQGADDYVTKPFSIKELVARIHANVRKYSRLPGTLQKPGMPGSAKANPSYGEIQMDFSHFTALVNGNDLELTPKEFYLLSELVCHAEQVLTREQLVARLWDREESYVDDNTLSVYIRRLRRKISACTDTSYIQTARGIGYCLNKHGGLV